MSGSQERYSRQLLLPGIGPLGQQALGQATAVIVGLGALGTSSAGWLARAGVGRLRLIDRDLVEWSNLQRQVLFVESDARDGVPKAVAAARELGRANSEIALEVEVADLTAANIDRLCGGAAVVVDGTDNFETRFLINEWSVREAVPWIYGAAVGTYGLTLSIQPGNSACLACVFESAPPPEQSPTCDTVGVLGPLTGAIGALQAAEALKFLAGRPAAASRSLTAIDLETGHLQRVEVERRAGEACTVCGRHEFPHLEGRAGSRAARLCGRQAVQISRDDATPIDLERIVARLSPLGAVSRNEWLVRAHIEGYDLTIFADGRTLVSGTSDPAVARSLVARFVGA